MGCNYELHRTITSIVGSNSITLHDRIVNCSDVPKPLMLLYHLNFGYPLIAPTSVLKIPNLKETEPFDEIADQGLDKWDKFPPPTVGMAEEVFLHKLRKTTQGEFSINNPAKSPGIGVAVKFTSESLPYLALWKSLRPGEYVVALEPCNNHLRGVAWEHEHGNLRWLAPGETEETSVEFLFS